MEHDEKANPPICVEKGDGTYKDAEYFEKLSDKDFSWVLTRASQDLNDSDENVSGWMPISALLDSAADRIKRLSSSSVVSGERLPLDRDTLGRMVREAWVRWAKMQPNLKSSWLKPYDALSEPDKEADRQIGEAIAKWTMIHANAAGSGSGEPVAWPEEADKLFWSAKEFIDDWKKGDFSLSTLAALDAQSLDNALCRYSEARQSHPAPTRIDGLNGEELTIEWPGRLRLSINDKGVGYAVMWTPGKWTAGKFDADTQQSQAAEEMRRALTGEKP